MLLVTMSLNNDTKAHETIILFTELRHTEECSVESFKKKINKSLKIVLHEPGILSYIVMALAKTIHPYPYLY